MKTYKNISIFFKPVVFDWGKMLKIYTLIFFGDDHNMNAGRKWLIHQIVSSSIQIPHLAIEYVESDHQYLIDQFNSGRLKTYLKEKYKEFPGCDPSSIIELIAKAKTKGIKVIGVEIPEHTFKNWKSRKAQKVRKEYISNKILNLCQHGKVIALLGADHVEKKGDNTYREIIRSEGGETIKTLSVVFIGGKSWSLDSEEYWIRKLELIIQNKGKSKEFFTSKITNQKFPCDWIIHFPQLESLR